MTRSFVLASLFLAGCAGAPPPEPEEIEQPPAPTPIEVKKALPKPKNGVRTMNAANIQKAFLPEAKVVGTNGRECGAWKDRVIVTQPASGGDYDIRIRPRSDDLDEDCKWEGDSLIEARVEGRVVGVVWPHVVVYREEPGGAGRLQVMRGTTGGITAEVAQAMHPSYVRTLVVGFSVAVVPEMGEVDETRTCQIAIEEAWRKTLEQMDESGQIHPKLDRTTPRCDPLALETCNVAFAFPYELVLSETAGQPAAGPVGCIGRPD